MSALQQVAYLICNIYTQCNMQSPRMYFPHMCNIADLMRLRKALLFDDNATLYIIYIITHSGSKKKEDVISFQMTCVIDTLVSYTPGHICCIYISCHHFWKFRKFRIQKGVNVIQELVTILFFFIALCFEW